jgi:hypothetical protein
MLRDALTFPSHLEDMPTRPRLTILLPLLCIFLVSIVSLHLYFSDHEIVDRLRSSTLALLHNSTPEELEVEEEIAPDAVRLYLGIVEILRKY